MIYYAMIMKDPWESFLEGIFPFNTEEGKLSNIILDDKANAVDLAKRKLLE